MALPLPLRIAGWRARRAALPVAVVVAAVLLAGAVRTALAPPPAGTAVVVAARDLPAGHVLATGDLTLAHLPPGAVPTAAAADPGDLVGRRLATAVPAALPLVPDLLTGERFTRDPPEGSVVVALTPADAATAALLRPGDRVDLVDDSGTLARGALVLEITEPVTGVLAPDRPPGVVVAVSPDEGHALAAATSAAPGMVLVP